MKEFWLLQHEIFFQIQDDIDYSQNIRQLFKVNIQTILYRINKSNFLMSVSEICLTLQTYSLTYISYTGIHILRSTYSSNKNYLMTALNCTTIYLGILDFIMIFSLGIGHLFHAWYPQPKTTLGLVLAMLACAISFLLIPATIFIISWQFIEKIVIFVLMMINGYSQSYLWPGFLAIVSQKYKDQNFLLSFWVTCTNSGNIIGFLLCNAIILWFNLQWFYCYIATFLYLLICTVITYLRVDQLPTQQMVEAIDNFNENIQAEVIQPDISLKAIILDPLVRDLSIIFAVQKSVTYGLIFWLPLYFSQIGFNNYKAYIMVCYQISSIFGSSLIGYIFKKFKLTFGVLLFPINLGLIACFFILKFVNLTLPLYFLLISICGILLGGSYNSVSGVIVISLTKNLPAYLHRKYVGFYSDATMAVGNITTSFTQILIGFVSSYNNTWIFLVFIFYSISGLFCVFHLLYYQNKTEQQKTNASLAIQQKLQKYQENEMPKEKGL